MKDFFRRSDVQVLLAKAKKYVIQMTGDVAADYAAHVRRKAL